MDWPDLRLTGKLLEGRTAIITGAASERGIGKATAALFSAHGARVAILDLDEAASRAAAADVSGDAIGLACNVTEKRDCETAVQRVISEFGKLDILLNNAAISKGTRIMDVSLEEYELVQAVNMRGTFLMSQAAIPHMRKRRSGNVICFSSVAGQRGGGLYGSAHYAASKAGVIGLAQGMARELAPEGIRVNVIAPSLIKTDASPNDSPERRAQFEKTVPMGRSGTIWEVAGAALFLASDLSGYVVGATIDVNGGFHIH